MRGIWKGPDGERPLTLPDDLSAIGKKILATGARLLVIDPLSAALSGSVDSYKDHDVRRALSPLARLAEGGTREIEIGPCNAQHCVVVAGLEAGAELAGPAAEMRR